VGFYVDGVPRTHKVQQQIAASAGGLQCALVRQRQTAYINEDTFPLERNPVAARDRDACGDLLPEGEAYRERKSSAE